MSTIDPEKKRQQLTEHYASLTDGELEKLAKEAPELTEVAREALRGEIIRRGLAVALEKAAPEVPGPEWRRPVTLRRFRDLPEAQLAKSILDTASIPCFLADENTVRLDWFYSNAIGGIKLWVNEEDAQAAAALLDAEIPETIDVEGVGEYEQPRCPKCGSLDISFEALNKPASYAGFFIGVPVPWKRSRWKCHACREEWEDATSESPPAR